MKPTRCFIATHGDAIVATIWSPSALIPDDSLFEVVDPAQRELLRRRGARGCKFEDGSIRVRVADGAT